MEPPCAQLGHSGDRVRGSSRGIYGDLGGAAIGEPSLEGVDTCLA